MRAPLIVLVAIYALTIAGLVTIPGVDGQGRPVPMDFLHAFYFVSYTATTIGFGEIPHTFTPAQRLWVTFCIYLTVVGWSYAFVKLFALLQDRWFQQAIKTQRFKHQVRRLTDPFYLVCSYGDTGSLLCRALDELGRRFVVVDPNENRIAAVDLAGYRADTPALAADARAAEVLTLAGLEHPACLGVLALTDTDQVNLSIAAAARLLRPQLPVICRAETPAVAADLSLFEVEHVINPHERFGQYLVMAIQSPGSYQLHQWLTGMPGTRLGKQAEPPRGPWIVYGDSLFAHAVARNLRTAGLEVEALPSSSLRKNDYATGGLETPTVPPGHESLSALLERSGTRTAAGFVAGADDDVRNLSIVVAARRINPELFFVVRQNQRHARPLFEAFDSDIAVTSSEIVVHECLAELTTPLLSRFIQIVADSEDTWADAILLKLRSKVSRDVPEVWTVAISDAESPACADFIRRKGETLRLDHLIRNPDDRETHLRCVPLLFAAADSSELTLPEPETPLKIGDRILFAGTPECRRRQELCLININMLHYVYFGQHIPAGWIMRKWLAKSV